MDDKRSYPRVNAGSKLKYRVVDDAGPDVTAAGLATNISGGGISFTADTRMPDGTLLALQLALPGFPSDVIALARIVWQRKNPDRGFDIGCEFHWVGWESSLAQQKVAEFIRDKLDA